MRKIQNNSIMGIQNSLLKQAIFVFDNHQKLSYNNTARINKVGFLTQQAKYKDFNVVLTTKRTLTIFTSCLIFQNYYSQS